MDASVSPSVKGGQGHKAVTFKGPEDAGRLGGMVVAQNIKNGIAVGSNDFTYGYILKTTESRVFKGYLSPHVHGHICTIARKKPLKCPLMDE